MVARLEKCRTSAEGLVDEIEGPTGTKVIANHFASPYQSGPSSASKPATWSSRIWAKTSTSMVAATLVRRRGQ